MSRTCHLPAAAQRAAPNYLSVHPAGTILAVKLQPRAASTEICEPIGSELKIKVSAPPVDSAANEALLKLLAETLGCARNRIELIRGQTSRHKIVMLHGFKPEEVRQKFSGQ